MGMLHSKRPRRYVCVFLSAYVSPHALAITDAAKDAPTTDEGTWPAGEEPRRTGMCVGLRCFDIYTHITVLIAGR
jgi:hypothetical protein